MRRQHLAATILASALTTFDGTATTIALPGIGQDPYASVLRCSGLPRRLSSLSHRYCCRQECPQPEMPSYDASKHEPIGEIDIEPQPCRGCEEAASILF